MLNVQRRRPSQGLSFLMTALQENPGIPDYWLGYLEALLLSGRMEEAASALDLARQHGLGAAVDEFANRLEAACADNAQRALLAALANGDPESALDLASAMVGDFPERGVPWKVLGALLWAEGRCAEALDAMQASVGLLPRDAEAHCNLGLSFAKSDRFDEAEACLRKAIEIDPTFATAHYRLGMTYSLQGRLAEAAAGLRKGISLRSNYTEGDDAQNFSNLLFILSHDPTLGPGALSAEHRRFGECFENDASWPRRSTGRDPDRVLKVGFVSGDFREHAVSFFIEPLFARLCSSPRLELHAYSNDTAEDRVTHRLRSHVPYWHGISGVPDVRLADGIMADGIDILIDLSGHTALNRLPVFARKPAPVQVSCVGYPGTTGLRAVDYYLADRQWLPQGHFDALFTEKLVYLPDRWAFQPHAAAPTPGPLPAMASGRLTFGSFNRIDKINDATLDLWSMLLRELPDTQLLLGAIRLPFQRKKLLDGFAERGIERRRLMFHPPCGMDEYLSLYGQVDLCLDTVPFNGGTTTLHALWMGVPTLTLAGSTPAARAGAGILGKVGLCGFIAASAADFVAAGRHWSEQLPALALLRAGLRSDLQRSPCGRPDVIAAHFERALRHMWRRWCEGLSAESFSTDGAELAGT
jgi:predicted O-linked N-acetylglucosamine transferase (SPINDLY family)